MKIMKRRETPAQHSIDRYFEVHPGNAFHCLLHKYFGSAQPPGKRKRDVTRLHGRCALPLASTPPLPYGKILCPGSERKGFLLLEIMLALIIFAIAVVGLTRAMNAGIEAQQHFLRDDIVRRGIQARLDEIRMLPGDDIELTTEDEIHGITYEAEINPLDLENGPDLDGMYVCKVSARYQRGEVEEVTVGEVYFYRAGE